VIEFFVLENIFVFFLLGEGKNHREVKFNNKRDGIFLPALQVEKLVISD